MFELRNLRNERHEKLKQARALTDKPVSKEVSAQVDAILKEIDGIDDEIHRRERLRDIVNGNIASGANGSDREALAALGAFARLGDTSGFQNAMTEGADSGGILVPYEQGAIARVAALYNPIAGYCRVENIGTSPAKFSIPVLVTGAATAWVDETETRAETAAPSLKAVEFVDGEVSALVPVSSWALEDTILGQIVTEEIGRAFGRALAAAIARGTGVKQPFGILAAPTATTADGTRALGTFKHLATTGAAITADDLMAMVYDLQPEYRQAGVFVMTSATLGLIRGLKDEYGRFLWEPSLAPGQPSTLLGFPVCECNDWDEVAAGKYPVAFGDLKRAYCIVNRSMAFIRDPYSAKPYVQIYGRHRVSGNVVDTCALRLLKMSS